MDYRSLHIKTVADLRRIAKDSGVKVPAGTTKTVLIELILENEKGAAMAAEAPTAVNAQAEVKPQRAAAPAEGEQQRDAPRRGRPRKKPAGETPAGTQEQIQGAPKARLENVQTPEGTGAEKAAAQPEKTNVDAPESGAREMPRTETSAPKDKPSVPEAESAAPQTAETNAPQPRRPVENAPQTAEMNAPQPRRPVENAPQAAEMNAPQPRRPMENAPQTAETNAPQTAAEANAPQTRAPMENAPEAAAGDNLQGGYRRPMSTQQRMGVRAQPVQGAYRAPVKPGMQPNRPAGRFGPESGMNRSPRGYDNQGYGGYRRQGNLNDNPQGGYRRPMNAGENPQGGYRRPMNAGENPQGVYRRPVNPEENPQGMYNRAINPETGAPDTYRRPINAEPNPQDGYRRPMNADTNAAENGNEPNAYARAPMEAEGSRYDAGMRAPDAGDAQPGAVRRAYTPDEPRSYAAEDFRVANPGVPELLATGECGDGAGILEIHPDGYGFLRAENYLPGSHDVYVSAAQIRRFNLRTGDYVVGKTRAQQAGDRSVGLIFINEVNGQTPDAARSRKPFDSLIPVYPDERLSLENPEKQDISLRLIDMIAPIGKGQRGMIVSQPKAGKTTLLKKIANAITTNNPDVHLIVLLIDERPEEVTDMKRSIQGEVIYSTFDEAPENHARVSEMVLERAQRLVEIGKDVVVLLDSITRLARAYNLVIPPTGRSLSGGLDPGALFKPKRFFGAARNIENGGSLTIIATALVDTGSRMDDIIFEEFKGTGNMELHLDRSLSDRRIFPAIDMYKSGTRREELLLTPRELEGVYQVRRMLSKGSSQEAAEQLIGLMEKTKTNEDFYQKLKGWMNVCEKDGFTMR